MIPLTCPIPSVFRVQYCHEYSGIPSGEISNQKNFYAINTSTLMKIVFIHFIQFLVYLCVCVYMWKRKKNTFGFLLQWQKTLLEETGKHITDQIKIISIVNTYIVWAILDELFLTNKPPLSQKILSLYLCIYLLFLGETEEANGNFMIKDWTFIPLHIHDELSGWSIISFFLTDSQ